jgi:hypothetical protein
VSTQLQHVCISQGLPTYRLMGDGIEVLATGADSMRGHWFQIVRRRNGMIGVLLDFAPWQKEKIEQVGEFCQFINDFLLGDYATLEVRENQRHFYLYSLTEEKTLGSYLTELAQCCDIVQTMCESAGRTGQWSERQFQLAEMPVEDMPRYMQ